MPPIILITGFLGSGKSTLLRRIAQSNPHQKLAFVINEYSSFDVDGAALDLPQSISISGGNIFCNCRLSHFVEAIEQLSTLDCSAIIVEASGMSDPNAAAQLLDIFAQQLSRFEIKRCICVIDCKRFLRLSASLPVLHAQIQASDTLLLNKRDLVTEAQYEQLAQELSRINPRAQQIACQYCDVELALEEHQPYAGQESQIATNTPLRSDSLYCPHPIDKAALEAQLCRENSPFLRVKGFVSTADGQIWQLDYEGNACHYQAAPAGVETRLVFISTRKEGSCSIAALKELAQHFQLESVRLDS